MRSNKDLALVVLADAMADHARQLAQAAAAERQREAELAAEHRRRQAELDAERRRVEQRERNKRIATGTGCLLVPVLPLWLFTPGGALLWAALVACCLACAILLPYYPAGQEVISKPAGYAFAIVSFLFIVQACSDGHVSAQALWMVPIAAALAHVGYGMVRGFSSTELAEPTGDGEGGGR